MNRYSQNMSGGEYHPDDTVYYFAYGSNMNPQRMKERGAHFTLRIKHSLNGYSLAFNKTSFHNPGTGCANIVQNPGGIVEGIVYRISVRGLYKLDGYEGHPHHYRRTRLYLDIGGEPETVKTYIAMPDKVADGLHPTRSYMRHLLTAKDDLSPGYYEHLLNIETFD